MVPLQSSYCMLRNAASRRKVRLPYRLEPGLPSGVSISVPSWDNSGPSPIRKTEFGPNSVTGLGASEYVSLSGWPRPPPFRRVSGPTTPPCFCTFTFRAPNRSKTGPEGLSYLLVRIHWTLGLPPGRHKSFQVASGWSSGTLFWLRLVLVQGAFG
jgi:hypothetical protein